MPYTVENPPEAIEGLPKHLIEIWVAAFNAAFKQYKGDEGKSAGTAWAAVKMKYKKVDDKWVVKEAVHPHGEHACVCSKCDNEILVEADVKCNTQKCPECDAPMIAKTAGERRESVLSDKNKSKLLQSALMSEYKIGVSVPIPKDLTIDEVFENKVVYDVDGQLYQSSYELDENGKAVFSDPKKVSSTRIFKAMESLQPVYADILQEAGRRNANLDSSRIKKIVALCQELLSSEAPDEEEIKKATKEATSVLKLIKAQVSMKTEDGIKFPSEAFAYSSSDNPDEWKLRLWENIESGTTRTQLNRAAAYLSPGGLRGVKAEIPARNLSEVKRVLRSEYRKLNVADDEMSKWVKEDMTRELVQNYVPLTEAKFDKGRATVVVIKPGFNADKSRYYPAEMLKRDYKVFEGQKMFADHPTEQEDEQLPERSVKSGGWVSSLKDVMCDENGIVTGIADIIEDWMMRKLANLRDKKMLSEMGISINAIGKASKSTVEGVETLVIEELTGCRSVDFVTEPGAGGIVTFYESDRSRDVDLVELSALKEKRPDLVKLIEADVREKIVKEAKRMSEQDEKITELEGQITTLTTERDTLKETAEKAEKDKAKAEAQASIKEAVDKAELPDAAKERILDSFKDAETADGIEEAIKSEVDYIAKLSEAGKVKNLGSTQVDTEKGKEALKESFKRMNPDWTEDQVNIAVSGR